MTADIPMRRRAYSPIELFPAHLLEYYQKTAEDYEPWADGVRGKVARRLSEVAAPRRGEQALDAGCGTGLVTRHLAAHVSPTGRVVGIDISDHLLAVARERSRGGATFLTMPAEAMTFPDASFDLVTLGQSLSFMTDPAAALADVHRVLKTGGRVAVACQRRSLSTQAQTAFFACLGRQARRHPMRIPRPGDANAVFGEPRVIAAMLRGAGFSAIDRTQTIIGGGPTDARSWTELMAGAGPYPHTLLSVLGPRAQARFEAELEAVMDELEEEAFQLHHAFTFAVARKL